MMRRMMDLLPDWIGILWPLFLAPLNVSVALYCTAHIVREKRDVRAAIGWTGLVWLVPLIGGMLYYCFGINRIQRRAVTLLEQKSVSSRSVAALAEMDRRIQQDFVEAYPRFVGLAQVARCLTGSVAAPGSRVATLIDGDQAYPAMLRAIAGAERSVSLLSYIFDSDRVGDMFLDELLQAQQRGVEVRVLIDDVGSRYSRPNMIRRLRSAGVPVASFLPTRIPWMVMYANLRNHRKILVVDGKTGFTGGTNIREGHWLALEPKAPVQCLHFRLDGPIVAHLQRMFAIDWKFAAGEALEGERWFPPLQRAGPVWAQGIPDGPDEDFEKLTDLIMGALSVATRTVWVVTPYFLPDTALIRALNTAAMRGVDVRILLPERNNIPVVGWAAAAQYRDLVDKGCRIFLSPPPFDHTKLFVVDGIWSLIGSTNWDPRSLRLNFEFNVECYDAELGGYLHELAESKAAAAREVTRRELNRLPWLIQVRNGVARLASPYL
ncbi:MAG: cardiolipin synthase [Pirellulaceae bacterium]|nr:cardiolipin synthase [Pirellulaceae bacterium]